MKKVLKWIGIVLGVLVVLLIAAFLFLFITGNSKINKTYDVQVEAVAIPDDAASVEQGQHLAEVTCSGCHGDDYAGAPFFDDPALGYIPSANLTSGVGGGGESFSDEDWVRAIRHGIGKDGKSLIIMPSNATYYFSDEDLGSLIIMPSNATYYFSDEDLGSLIAYLKSIPTVENEPGEKSFGVPGILLIAAGPLSNIFPAELIDHNAPRPTAPDKDVTAAYGDYLVKVNDCRVCHGAELVGGPSPEPGGPPGPDITSVGLIGAYQTEDAFLTFFRTGMTPYNKEIDPAIMPWEHFGLMTDEELTAMYLYLKSIP